MTKKDNKANLQITTDFAKITPKFCTTTSATLVNGDNVVLSFIYSEKNENGEFSTSLIDRIALDKNHCQELEKLLNKINEKFRN